MRFELDLFADMLSLINERGNAVPEQSFSLFPTQVGSRWQGELLVCGRAVNGYEPVWTRSDVATAAGRTRTLNAIQTRYEQGDCQMRWVTERWNARKDYNTARSAFWRVIRATTYDLGIVPRQNPEWSAALAWTNLYSIAPSASGNPSAKLQQLQLELTRERLARDLAELHPRRLLFLAGMDWAAPFLERHKSEIESRNGLVQGFGTLHLPDGSQVATVVAKHPQGKRETAWTAEVLDSFAQVA